jgi:hypothetical protein
MNHTEAFAFYDTVPSNVRYSWTAVNKAKRRAVITVWQDGFINKDGKPMHHRVHGKKSNGFAELVKHVAYAREHCNGEFNVILAGAVDTRARRRSILWCEPRPGIKLKVVSFDADSGELWAEVV